MKISMWLFCAHLQYNPPLGNSPKSPIKKPAGAPSWSAHSDHNKYNRHGQLSNTDSPVIQNLALSCAYHTQEGSRPLNAGCLQLLFNMHTALLHILSLHIMTHHAAIKSGHLNDGLMKSIQWSRGPENSTKIYRYLPLDMILSLFVITFNTYNLLP
jgi:hypothetical protein